MDDWPFDDPPNAAVFTVRQIVDGQMPILYVSHEEEDGAWQFLTGEQITTADALLVGLKNIVNRDPSVLELAELPNGWIATRNNIGVPWQRAPICAEKSPDRPRSVSSRDLPLREYWTTIPWLSFPVIPLRLPVMILEAWRENRAFRRGIESAWTYCESVWDRPYVHVWCQLMHTPWRPGMPYATSLIYRFHKEFSKQPEFTEFILGKSRSENPVIAAYAVECLSDPNLIAPEVRNRTEIIALRDWFTEERWSFGDWVEKRIREHNRLVIDEMRELAKPADDPNSASFVPPLRGSRNDS